MIFQWPFRLLASLLPSPLMRRMVLTILTAGPSRKPSIWMRSGWVSIKNDSPSTSSSNIRDPRNHRFRIRILFLVKILYFWPQKTVFGCSLFNIVLAISSNIHYQMHKSSKWWAALSCSTQMSAILFATSIPGGENVFACFMSMNYIKHNVVRLP